VEIVVIMNSRTVTYSGRREQGFTLLEMIVVLVIIGLIAGLVGPNLFNRADRAKVQTAETQVKMLRGGIYAFRLDMGRLPSQEEGLGVLVRAPADESAEFWQGPYIDGAVPLDPWNRAYVYSREAGEFDPFSLYSLGADGQPGGTDLDADVGLLPAR
jgi:general secretion pathway protein G